MPAIVEHAFAGVARVTLPLPTKPGHVHAYVLESDDGWTLVDTGLGLPDAADLWRDALAELDGPVARIAITHFHPDHVGASADVATLTGAAVHQGALDASQCRRVWGSDDWPERIADWFARHGAPADVCADLVEQGAFYASLIRFARDPLPLDDDVAGWRVLATPGHADGHVCLLRDGVLVAGDHLLADISPAVGLYPESRPDPLGDYLGSLRLVERLAPRLALPGHGPPLDDPAVRARELIRHHTELLAAASAALDSRARTAYELSFELFGDDLSAAARRFAVAETLWHVEHLAAARRARRESGDRLVRYSAA